MKGKIADNQQEVYWVSDLQLAAYLKVSGFPLKDISPIGKGKAIFGFEKTNKLLEAEASYYNDANISARQFALEVRSLISLARQRSGDKQQASKIIQEE